MTQLIFIGLLLCPVAPKAALKDHLVGTQSEVWNCSRTATTQRCPCWRLQQVKGHTSSHVQGIFVGMATSPRGQDVPWSWAELFPQREAWAGSFPVALGWHFRNPISSFVPEECDSVLKEWPQIKTPHSVICHWSHWQKQGISCSH